MTTMLRIAQDGPGPTSNRPSQRRFSFLPHLIISNPALLPAPLPAPLPPAPLLPVSLFPVPLLLVPLLPVSLPIPLLPLPLPLVPLLPSDLHPTPFFPLSPAPLPLLRYTAYPLLRGYPSPFFPASLLLPHPVIQQTRRFTPLPFPPKKSVRRKPRSSMKLFNRSPHTSSCSVGRDSHAFYRPTSCQTSSADTAHQYLLCPRFLPKLPFVCPAWVGKRECFSFLPSHPSTSRRSHAHQSSLIASEFPFFLFSGVTITRFQQFPCQFLLSTSSQSSSPLLTISRRKPFL